MIIPVAAAILFSDDKILIAKRASHKHLAGYWEFPGGKIEINETPEMCIHRELREELNIQVRVNEFLAANDHDENFREIVSSALLPSTVIRM